MVSVAAFIADSRLSEQRRKDDNVAPREETDKTSMCDKIVLTSAALQKGTVTRIQGRSHAR